MNRQRLAYLDGIRGLAALFVVACHAQYELVNGAQWRLLSWVPVVIFISLSGYCLALPFRDPEHNIDFRKYILRRARRLLPPYYSALILTLFTIFLWGHWMTGGIFWQQTQPSLNTSDYLAHFFLIHNLYIKWVYGISGPLWTVATEWQIYFALPIIIFLYRKHGWLTTLNACICAITIVLPILARLNNGQNTAHFEMLLIFAFGAFSAFRSQIQTNRQYYLSLAAILILGIVVTYSIPPEYPSGIRGILLYCAVGCMAALLFSILEYRASMLKRILSTRLLAGLGAFSYSLYLVHMPIVAMAQHCTRHPMLVGIPTSVAVAYLFHVIFERPFMRTGRNDTQAI